MLSQGDFKFGGHMYLWIDRWSDDALSLLDNARSLGLNLFEVSLGDEARFTPSLLRRRAEDLGVEITIGPGGVWPMEADISADDPEMRRQGMVWHRRMIDWAAECGAVAYCGAMYGHPGRVMRRRPPEGEFSRMAENFGLLADHALRAGVLLVVEPMSRFRTHLINTPDQALRLAREAGGSNIRITLDTYHMVTEVRDYAAAVISTLPYLWGIHACENDRGAPGEGLIPWDPMFEALVRSDHQIRIMLETYNTSLDDFAYSRGLFQDVCSDPEAYVRTGVGFLRRCLSKAVMRAGGAI